MAASECSPAVSPAEAAALFQEGDAAHARCKKLLPPRWAEGLKGERELLWTVKPFIDRHMQHSPGAWQAALRQEALGQMQRRGEKLQAKQEEGQPCCDSCGLPTSQLKWCACRLKRYCGKDCQRRDFPAHKAECKKARGVA